MALASMLSAMKDLIMEVESLPATPAQREQLFRDKYSDLTGDEIADLARLPLEHLASYNTSIFSGERGVISNHMSMSVQLLERSWPEVHKQPFRLLDYMKALYRSHPWKSYKTEDLLKLFASKVLEESELLEVQPAIEDFVRFELLNFDIKRQKKDFDSDAFLAPDQLTLTSLEVDELLSLRFSVSPHIKSLALGSDVNAAFNFFRRNSRKLPQTISTGDFLALGSRNREALARWTYVNKSIFEYLSNLQYAELREVNELAEHFARDSSIQNEQELFVDFLKSLSELLAHQIIFISSHHQK